MMGLREKLIQKNREFEAGAPPEKLAVMHRATDDLRRSGIAARVLKEGDKAPAIALPNESGEDVSSAALLQKGPLIMQFYRGVW